MKKRSGKQENAEYWESSMSVRSIFILSLLGCFFPCSGSAMDIPGVGLGLFYENRVENKVFDEDMVLDYYGVSIRFRDERFVEVFAEFGNQDVDIEGQDINGEICYGLGLTFWLVRHQTGDIPFDLGLFSSFHLADYEYEPDLSLESHSADYSRFIAQCVFRADYRLFKPYIYAGILKTDMGLDLELFSESEKDEDLDKIQPAVKVGFDLALQNFAVIGLYAHHYESLGGGIYFNFWF